MLLEIDRLPTLDQVRAEMATRSLCEFTKQAWPIIEPDAPLEDNWHIGVIADHVQALVEGRLGKNNLSVNVPPGSLKSTIVSVCLPAWAWAQDPRRNPGLGPSWRGIFVAGAETVALRDSMKCRQVLESDWYRRLFRPQWRFDARQNAKGLFWTSERGFRLATTAGAKITGERGDLIAVDDPNDAAQAFSKAERDRVNTWWDLGAANRLRDMRHGKRVIIQQRLHEDDLTGHVTGIQPQEWDRLIIRQLKEKPDEGKHEVAPTGLGWVDHRQEGELFFPTRDTPRVVESERVRLGSFGFAGQHQQRPVPAEGSIFKRGFVRFYSRHQAPLFERTALSADTAFKEREENDYSVILGGAECRQEGRAGLYLTSRWKVQASFPELLKQSKLLGHAKRPNAFLIEDKASGQSLIQMLEQQTGFPIVRVPVTQDKVARAHACVPTWEAGRIFLPDDPEDAEWVDDLLEQLYGFPKMPHDDDADAFTQLVKHFYEGPAAMNISDDAIGSV